MGKNKKNHDEYGDLKMMNIDVDVNEGYGEKSYSPKNNRRPLQKSGSAKFVENVFGVDVSKQRRKIPEGHEMRYDPRTGQGSLHLKEGFHNNEDHTYNEKAANEHLRPKLPFYCGPDVLRENFGTGIFLYFDFLKFIGVSNFFLFILAVVNTAYHLYHDGTDSSDGVSSAYLNLYISHYSSSSYYVWLVTTIIACVLWYLFGPIYAAKINRFFRSQNEIDYEDKYEEGEGDEILDNRHFSHAQRASRFIASYIITIILLILCGCVVFGVAILERYLIGSAMSSIVIAGFIRITNFLWYFISTRLTRFEKHRTWTGYRQNNTFKYYAFKMINFLLMYIARYIVTNFIRVKPSKYVTYDKTDEWFKVTASACELDSVGDQMLYFILLDITVANIWELFWPQFLARLRRRKGETNNMANSSVLPDFDTADEYLELFYRQFIVYMGMTVFPLITGLSVISNILEFHIDKWKLLRIAKPPVRLDGSMKKFIVFFLFTNALFATFSFPYGAFFIITGTAQGNCTTSLYDNGPLNIKLGN